MRISQLVPVLLLAVSLTGCTEFLSGWAPREAHELPPYEGLGFTHREPTVQEQILAASDFSVELVRYTDDRYPRSTAFTAPDTVIFEYEPDELMQGLDYKMPVLMNKYLSYRPKMPKHYKVEMELKTLQTRIIGGNWKSGKFGRYRADIEAHMIARRPDSQVVLNRVYKFDFEQPRETFNGRQPTAEMDRGRMYDITESLIRRLAEETAWDVRRFDAKRWNVKRDARELRQSGEVKVQPTLPPAPLVQMPDIDVEDDPTTIEDLVEPDDAQPEDIMPLDDNGLRV